MGKDGQGEIKQNILNLDEKKAAGMLYNTVKSKCVLAMEPRFQALPESCIVPTWLFSCFGWWTIFSAYFYRAYWRSIKRGKHLLWFLNLLSALVNKSSSYLPDVLVALQLVLSPYKGVSPQEPQHVLYQVAFRLHGCYSGSFCWLQSCTSLQILNISITH